MVWILNYVNPGTLMCCFRNTLSQTATMGEVTTANRTLGLTAAGTMCRSNPSLGHYPIG